MRTAKPTGRPSILDSSQREVLRQLRVAEPSLSTRRLAARLEERCGVRISHHTVGTELRRLGFVPAHPAPRRAPPRAPTPPSLDPPASAAAQADACPKRTRGYAAPPALMPPAPSHRKAYPSDLTDEEWVWLEPLLPPPLPGGRPAAIPRRELANAMFYVLRNGCTWRALPHDFPNYSTVYWYFRVWRDAGVWQQVNDALRPEVRVRAGRDPTPSAASLDSQSVKTTEKKGSAASMAASA